MLHNGFKVAPRISGGKCSIVWPVGDCQNSIKLTMVTSAGLRALRDNMEPKASKMRLCLPTPLKWSVMLVTSKFLHDRDSAKRSTHHDANEMRPCRVKQQLCNCLNHLTFFLPPSAPLRSASGWSWPCGHFAAPAPEPWPGNRSRCAGCGTPVARRMQTQGTLYTVKTKGTLYIPNGTKLLTSGREELSHKLMWDLCTGWQNPDNEKKNNRDNICL